MAKIARKNFKLFGTSGSTTNFAEFGSQAASSPVKTKDIDTIQSLSAWLNGWQSAVDSGTKAPFLEDMNGLLYVFAYEIFTILENGVPEWDATTTYYVGSIVRKPDTFELYGSLTNNNVGNALPSQTDSGNWQFLFPVRTSTLIGTILNAQIDSVAASKITGQLTASQILTIATSQLTGQISNAQISDVASSKITGLITNAQIQSLDGSKITGSIAIPAGSIVRSMLSTGTGYVSGGGGVSVPVTMNDYNFFPSIETHSGTDAVNTFPSTDSGDTVGRFSKGNSQAYDIRWRYVTSSDNPRMWAVVDKSGAILHLWESEDPANHADMVEEDAPELCPFSESMLLDGQKIVSIPTPELKEIKGFLAKTPEAFRAHSHNRCSKRFMRKNWIQDQHLKGAKETAEIIDVVQPDKQRMARQWMLRSLAGRGNVAKMIREICKFSPGDGRLILPDSSAQLIGPVGLITKES